MLPSQQKGAPLRFGRLKRLWRLGYASFPAEGCTLALWTPQAALAARAEGCNCPAEGCKKYIFAPLCFLPSRRVHPCALDASSGSGGSGRRVQLPSRRVQKIYSCTLMLPSQQKGAPL